VALLIFIYLKCNGMPEERGLLEIEACLLRQQSNEIINYFWKLRLNQPKINILKFGFICWNFFFNVFLNLPDSYV
jgi:hypothetical protein